MLIMMISGFLVRPGVPALRIREDVHKLR